MENPIEAAHIMIADATADGINVDRTPRNWLGPTAVSFRSGSELPKDNNQEILDLVRVGDVPTPVGNGEAMCFFQYLRTMSIREFSNILSLGIKIYCAIPGRSYIAKVPINRIENLIEHPAVGWVDFYLPRYKYNHNMKIDRNSRYVVMSLNGRSKEYENDLVEIGVEILGSWPGIYEISLSDGQVVELAKLWWIKEIYESLADEVEFFTPSN
jgi:hypothetical protein